MNTRKPLKVILALSAAAFGLAGLASCFGQSAPTGSDRETVDSAVKWHGFD